MAETKKLGVIGGLGPAASARFYQRVIDLTQVSGDQDHIESIILNLPKTPDRTAFILGKSAESFVPPLNAAALQLEALGCQVLCVTCNTAHSRFDQVFAGLTTATALNMPEETARTIVRAGKHRVGLMATDGTIKAGVFQRALEAAGLEVQTPDEYHQAMTMSLIYDDIKAGKPADMFKFANICGYLRARECDCVVLGCTELSLVEVAPDYAGMLVVDPMDELAKAAIVACGGTLRE